jgi:hypothetical protein
MVRLHAELATARPEFELLAERTRSEDDSWVAHGRELLAMAEADLRSGALDEPWRHLHTAKRLEVYGLEKLEGIDGDHDRGSELRIRAAVVREEALDALGGWPRQAVVELLCDETEALKDEQNGTIIADDVITAQIVVVIGFAAGYAERMAPNVVATVASVTEPSETAEQDSNQ